MLNSIVPEAVHTIHTSYEEAHYISREVLIFPVPTEHVVF